MMIDLYNGDCLEVMKSIPDGSVDMVLTDPPYNTIACQWDKLIPMDEMWNELKRLIKPNGVILLFGSEPFSSKLRFSNFEQYKYDWYWLKNKTSGFVHAKNKPMKNLELISVFSSGTTVHKSQSSNRMTYNPQGLVKVNKTIKSGKNRFGTIAGKRPSHKDEFTQEYTNYPKMTLEFNCEHGLHPTQKPVALLEYLIKTYTNENETVLDFTMGSGSTMIACLNTNRKGIGIELDKHYFDVATKRINEHKAALDAVF